MCPRRETFRHVRADKLLAGLGYGSRREVGMAMRRGFFKVDGQPYTDASEKLDLAALRKKEATFDDEPLEPLPPLTVLLHKPVGYICSRDDAGSLVYDLLPSRWRNRNPALSVAGRLDKDSSGLVILSDDGGFVHRMISPQTNTPKEYMVTLVKPLTGDEAALFSSGTMMLRGEAKPLKPVEIEALGEREARLTLHEGRYHQVRRMFAAVGNEVLTLHRTRIGDYTLDTLPPGTHKIIVSPMEG
ncbi:MAG: rRNA pseudouridine synthase [Alphaproteobacteria bacterium]|nr:rRNA pseudouridine synthase [Alphaproteobacteria bacterium]